MKNNYNNKRTWISCNEKQQPQQQQPQQQEEHTRQSKMPSISSSSMNEAKRFRRGDETVEPTATSTTIATAPTTTNAITATATTTVPHIQNTTYQYFTPSTSTSSSSAAATAASSFSSSTAAAVEISPNNIMEDDVIIVDDDILPSNKLSGDFHSDTGLSTMYLDREKNQFGNEYYIIVDHCVMTGIVDHVFSDPENEVLGLLGGVYDEQKNMVHVKHYCASIREVDNISIDGVECDGNEVVKAQNNFSDKGLTFVGWYHSHPRIPPFPSMKDLGMQHEMQLQAPYAVGIICAPYYNESTRHSSNDKHTFYFNCFRTRPSTVSSTSDNLSQTFDSLSSSSSSRELKLEALSVTCTINYQAILTPQIQREIQKTLQTAYTETRETYLHLKKMHCGQNNNQRINFNTTRSHQTNEESMRMQENAKSIFLTSQYEAFLLSFWKDSIIQSGIALSQDVNFLRSSNEGLQAQIQKKCQFLLQYITEEDLATDLSTMVPQDDESVNSLFTSEPLSADLLTINSPQFIQQYNEEVQKKQITQNVPTATPFNEASSTKAAAVTSVDSGAHLLQSLASAGSSRNTAATRGGKTITQSAQNIKTSPRSSEKYRLFGHRGKDSHGDYEYYTSVTYCDVNFEIKEFVSYNDLKKQDESIGQIVKVINHTYNKECSLEVRRLLPPYANEIRFSKNMTQETPGECELFLSDIDEFIPLTAVKRKVHVMKYDDYVKWKFADENDRTDEYGVYYYSKLYLSKEKKLVDRESQHGQK